LAAERHPILLNKENTMIGRMIAVSALLAFVVTTSASAQNQNRGTKAQQEACQADVFRVCDDAVPDENRIIECLNRNLQKLSFKCQLLIEPDPAKRSKIY
jgi:Cysteine rich repeat